MDLLFETSGLEGRSEIAVAKPQSPLLSVRGHDLRIAIPWNDRSNA